MTKAEKAAYHKAYSKLHPEKGKAYMKAYRKANPEKMKDYQHIWKIRKYKITVDRYNQMLSSQNNCCAICKNPFVGSGHDQTSPCIDHNHITGKVRALLCHKCNKLLGYVNEKTIIFKNAVNYLEFWEQQA